jgi:hypothetical protein
VQVKQHTATRGGFRPDVPSTDHKALHPVGFKRLRSSLERSVAAGGGLTWSGSSAGSKWGAGGRAERPSTAFNGSKQTRADLRKLRFRRSAHYGVLGSHL